MTDAFTPTTLSAATGISVPYASQILGGTRQPSVPLAIRIYRQTGVKFAPIDMFSDEEIDVLERVRGAA